MKTLKIILPLLFLGCTYAANANDTKTQKKQVNTTASTIIWKGYKNTGNHEGIIALKSGILEFDGERLIGGSFVVNMKSLKNTDQVGSMQTKLERRLKSPYFFGVNQFPYSKIVFTKVMPTNTCTYKITAELTIKNKSKPIEFELCLTNTSAKAHITIDRTKYDIRYGSDSFIDNLGDRTIKNNFDLLVSLVY